MKTCRRGLHQFEGGQCYECKLIWNRETEKGRAYIANATRRRQRKSALINQAIKNRTTSAHLYIGQTRLFIREFLTCWHSSNEGHYLPKESLQTLLNLREKALKLRAMKVSKAPLKTPIESR